METFNLTKTQEQFRILHKIYPGNTAYNIPSVFRIKGVPDIGFLNESLRQIAARHEMLRATLVEEGSLVAQKTGTSPSYKVDVVYGKPFAENCIIPEEVMEEIHQPFNLINGPLLRARLFVYSDSLSYLTIVFHHIIVDLRAKEIFASELQELYNSFVLGTPANLREPVSYKEYATWQKEWLGSPEAEKMLENWQKELGEPGETLSLPTDFDRPRNLSPANGERYNFILPTTFSEKIKSFAKTQSVSPFVVLLSAYTILLSRLSGQQEITVGIPLTNRRKEGSDSCFGCFMNIVPVKISIQDGDTTETLMRQIRQKMMFAHRNQELPLLSLINLPKYKKATGANTFYQAGFTFEPPMELQLPGLEIEPVLTERRGAQLEMFLIFFEKEGNFYGTFEYSTELFLRETILRWKEVFVKIIESMVAAPEKETSGLDILPEKEWGLLKTWNDTDSPYEKGLCLHQKFEEMAACFPNQPALTFYNTSLTYSELNTHSNRLAHFLIDNGARVEDKIGICIDRSIEMIVAIYATLKVGAAYVPLESEAPNERLKTISENAQLKFILTTRQSAKNLELGPEIIFLDKILAKNISEKTGNPVVNATPGNLAYIIYTSGSTGKPKGVMIEHRSVMNKIGWMQTKFPLRRGESMLQKTPITFDVSVWEIFWWMFVGGHLDLLKPGGEKDPKSMTERIQHLKPAVLIFVPSVFSLFLDYLSATRQEGSLSGIRWIVLIGEALTPSLTNRYYKMYEKTQAPILVNTYGPTEATVAVSWYECPPVSDTKKIYIGKPISNTKLLAVNNQNKLQPIGIPGELVIAGVNLARGYLGDPGQTGQKFIELPLPDGGKTRAYKTGDLAKWEPNGEIDFIGRTDNQVKIRGIRVELGDIETKIMEHPDVSEAAVILFRANPENKLLTGYMVARDGKSGISKNILEFLKEKLPPYMIPSQLIELGKMPLTTSGKIDRKNLPAPVFISENPYTPPVSEFEKQLVDIWKEILNSEKVGITDNFFELGGDSLLAVSLATRIQQKLNTPIDVIRVMEYPNIKVFSEYLAGPQKPAADSISVEERAALRRMSARRK